MLCYIFVFVRCSVGVSVCLVCCVFDSVCELFGETIHSVHLSVPSIGFVYVFVCRKLAPHLGV